MKFFKKSIYFLLFVSISSLTFPSNLFGMKRLKKSAKVTKSKLTGEKKKQKDAVFRTYTEAVIRDAQKGLKYKVVDVDDTIKDLILQIRLRDVFDKSDSVNDVNKFLEKEGISKEEYDRHKKEFLKENALKQEAEKGVVGKIVFRLTPSFLISKKKRELREGLDRYKAKEKLRRVFEVSKESFGDDYKKIAGDFEEASLDVRYKDARSEVLKKSPNLEGDELDKKIREVLKAGAVERAREKSAIKLKEGEKSGLGKFTRVMAAAKPLAEAAQKGGMSEEEFKETKKRVNDTEKILGKLKTEIKNNPDLIQDIIGVKGSGLREELGYINKKGLLVGADKKFLSAIS